MSDFNDRMEPGKGLTDGMMVIVNKDWSRTYAASIRTVKSENCHEWVGICKMKKENIVSAASDKYALSTNMDELATIIEDRISKEIPAGTPVIAGTHYFLS